MSSLKEKSKVGKNIYVLFNKLDDNNNIISNTKKAKVVFEDDVMFIIKYYKIKENEEEIQLLAKDKFIPDGIITHYDTILHNYRKLNKLNINLPLNSYFNINI